MRNPSAVVAIVVRSQLAGVVIAARIAAAEIAAAGRVVAVVDFDQGPQFEAVDEFVVDTLLAEAAKEVGRSCYFVVGSVVLIMVELVVVAMGLFGFVVGLVAVSLELQSAGVVADFGMSVDFVDFVVECQKTVVGGSAVGIGHL